MVGLQACKTLLCYTADSQTADKYLPAMIALIKKQDACLCGRTLGPEHFSYVWRCSEHRLKEASLVFIVPVPMLDSLSSLFFRTLCNK